MIIEPSPANDEPQQSFDPPGYVVEIMNGQDIFVGEEIVLLQLENGSNKINNLSNSATNFGNIINNLDLSNCFEIGNSTNGAVLDLVSKLNINNGINNNGNNNNNVENTANNSNMNLRKRNQHQINISPRKKRPPQFDEDINIINSNSTVNLIYPVYNTNNKNNVATTNIINNNILNNNNAPSGILNFGTINGHGLLKNSSTCNSHNAGKTQFVCPECSKTFETDKYLSMHLSLHKYPDHRLPSSSPTINLSSKVKKIFVASDKESAPSAETLSNILKFSSTSIPATKATTATSLLMNTIQQQQQQQQHQQQNIQQLQQQMQQPNGQWTCPYCQKTFVQNSNFKNHVRTHSDERPFVCDICSIGFKERYHLKKHVLFKHTDDLKETCRICGKCFKDSTAVRAHERIHSEVRPYGCGLCGKTFKTSECLWHHENRSKTCGKAIIAKKMQQVQQQQQQQVLDQTGGGNVSRFTRVTGIGNSLNVDASKPLQQPQMPQPRRQKRSKLAESLQSLMKTDNAINTNNNNTFQQHEQQQIHQQQSLLNAKLFLDNHKINSRTTQNSTINDLDIISEMCLETLAAKVEIDELTQNKNNNFNYGHNSLPDSMANVDLANYNNDNSTQHSYASSTTSTANASTISSENRPYICRICDSAFKLKVHLKKHHLYRHTDEYPCECSICGKRFKDTSAVRLHERIHSDDRPFRCECGKSFKTNENLWGHKNRGPCEWKIMNSSASTTAVAAATTSTDIDVTTASDEMDDEKGEVPIILSKPILGIVKIDDGEMLNKRELDEQDNKINIKRVLINNNNNKCNSNNVDDVVDDKSRVLATSVTDSKTPKSKTMPSLIPSSEQDGICEDVLAVECSNTNSVNDYINTSSCCVVVGNSNNNYNNNNVNIPTAIVTPIQRLKMNAVIANNNNASSNNNNNNNNNSSNNNTKSTNIRNVINVNPINAHINSSATDLSNSGINNNLYNHNNNNNNINNNINNSNNKIPLLLKLPGNPKETMTLLIPTNKKITNDTNSIPTNNNHSNNIIKSNNINNNSTLAINQSNNSNNKGNKILKTLIVNKNNMTLINNLIMAKNNNINTNTNNNINIINNNNNNRVNNTDINNISSASVTNNNTSNNINNIGTSIKTKLVTLTKNYQTSENLANRTTVNNTTNNNNKNKSNTNFFDNINNINDNSNNADLANIAAEENEDDNNINCNNNINALMYNKINNINNGNDSFMSEMTESTDDASESLSLDDDEDDEDDDDDMIFNNNSNNNSNNSFSFPTFNNIFNTDRCNATTSATFNSIYSREQRLNSYNNVNINNNININNNNSNNININNINSLNMFDEIEQTMDIQIDDICPSLNENEMMINLLNTPWPFEENSLFSLID